MIRILGSDLLIADVITPLAGNEALQGLAEKYKLKPGGKVAINKQQFDEFSAAVAGAPITLSPGGSSANTLATLSKILGDEVSIRFIGAVGEGLSSTMIRESLEDAHIQLLPESLPAKPAVSYVMLFSDGQRTIATYPGNAREVLKPEFITDALLAETDAVLIQGSLWAKLDEGYANRLLDVSVAQGKQVWLALPTYSRTGGEFSELFKKAISKAQLLLGNEEELMRIYDLGADEALSQLQFAFRGNAQQVAFITAGNKGAAVVTHAGIDYIPSFGTQPGAIVNTLGAGDTAFAGFIAGYLKQLPHRKSAELAMQLAGQKLRVNGARLPNPKAVWNSLNF